MLYPRIEGIFYLLKNKSSCYNRFYAKINFMLQGVKNFILDLFFPKKCLGCGRAGIYICQSCLEKIEMSQNNTCPFCDRPIPNTFICQKCQKIHFLNRLIWAIPYHNPMIKELIRIFKYHYIKELSAPLGNLLIKSLKTFNFEFLTFNFLIVPIPLHNRKLCERDFNQAELLAKEVAEYFSLPLENKVLKRKKYTPQQARKKSDQERKEALKNAFEINPEFIKKCVNENENLLKDKIIVLVDDVTTTGATLSEAAKVLKRAGAREVWGLVIAKG